MPLIKGNQPTLLQAAAKALAGPDAGFADASRAEEGKGHGGRERRAIRTAPADGIGWPHAAQVMRIRRDSGPTRGSWTHKEIAYGITSLPPDLAGPRHLGIYARNHWAIENREHYVRGQDVRRGSPAGPHGEPARCLCRHPQPGHRRIPPHRVR